LVNVNEKQLRFGRMIDWKDRTSKCVIGHVEHAFQCSYCCTSRTTDTACLSKLGEGRDFQKADGTLVYTLIQRSWLV